jgi:hypothetical protein
MCPKTLDFFIKIALDIITKKKSLFKQGTDGPSMILMVIVTSKITQCTGKPSTTRDRSDRLVCLLLSMMMSFSHFDI